MKKVGVNCWKIFKKGLKDTSLKRLSYIEKEEDVLYYLPQQPEAHLGHELISCLNCGEVYVITIGYPEYIGPSIEKKLKQTNCIKCSKSLGSTSKPYPDFYLGENKIIYRSKQEPKFEEDEFMIVKDFWGLYEE